jgi:hypothetical protein
MVGPAATHDEWMLPRKKPALDDLPARLPRGLSVGQASRVVRIAHDGNIFDAVRRACEDEFALVVQAAPGLCSELTEQASRRFVHLVNYRADDSAKNIVTRMRLPAGCHVKTAMLASPERDGDLNLPFEEQDGIVTFTVPEVCVYEIAVLTMK